ncbi:MAG: cobalt transporter [Alphaproteobacteria bacterium]|nr:cobalt transporter [Alphaproteobacteria bacterium]
MIGRVLAIGLLAGLVAGVIVTGAQMLRVIPLIHKAETYETSAPADHHAHATAVAAHSHDEDGWAPEDGLERTAFTLLANVLTAVGFGLLLNAALAIYGGPVGLRKGVLWGLAGFTVFVLAPSLGLPPELPGLNAADLFHRQSWYLGTVLATGGGLALLIFLSHWAFKAAGLVLIAAPHAIGAPHPAELGGSAPPELAAMFAIASIVTAALLWVVLGGVSGYLHARYANPA